MPPEQMGAGVDYGSPLAGSAHTQHLKQLRHLNQEYPHINYPDTQVKHQSLRVSVQIYRKSTKRQCHNFTMRLSLLINYGSRNRKTKQGLQRDPGRISCQFRLTYRILSMAKKQKSLQLFLYFDRKWLGQDETRHQFRTVPGLAKTGFEPNTGGITRRV